jgi:Tfp pilus assembly protein FimV
MATQKAKMEAHENVIDKVLAWSTLTSEEETIKQEIIKQRAEMKTKRVEMEAKIAEVKTILEKKKAWTTLTSDEQAKLDASHSEWHWKGMKGMRK